MASAAALQFPQPAGRFPPTPPLSPSPLYSIPRTRPAQPILDHSLDAPFFSPGALAAAKSMADHASLQKRSSFGSSRTAASQAHSFAQSDAFQPQKSMAKVRFKSNFKKLTQQKNSHDAGPTLDLSQTAEENEKRSGLGLYPSEPSSPSFAQISFPSAPTDFGSHTRSISHTSQFSSSSGAFKPSAPFAIPTRASPRPHTPPTTISYSTSVISGVEPYGEGLSNLSQEVSYDATPTDSPLAGRKPFVRVNTSGSESSARLGYSSSYVNSSQNIISSPSLRSQAPSTRPRRSTNQSSDTAATPKSRTSIDRAFSFVTRSASGGDRDRDDPLDPVTRAATIQAARQAFQEKEEAKAKKYQQKEQKAAAKAQRKRETNTPTTFGDGRRRRTTSDTPRARADSRNTAVTGFTGSEEKPSALGQSVATEYVRMPAGPSPQRGERALQGSSREKRKKKTMRGTMVKSRYVRFLTWLKTRLFSIGGRGRRSR